MHPRSFYKLLTAAVIAFAAALSVWILTPEYSAGTFFGQPLIPGLMEKINDIEAVSIEHGGKTMTFLRDGAGSWTLVEADGYPADKERIRNVLIGLAGLEKIEPKTALPEFYSDLRVEDNMNEKSGSYLVTLLTNEGNPLTRLLVGKQTNGISWNGQGYFVRFPDDAQSWLVRGNVDVTGDMRSWLAVRLLPLVKGRTSSITIVDGTKTREAVYKRTAPAMAMQASFLSDGHFIISADFIEKMENALTAFDFEDVAVRPGDLAEETPFSSAFIETFDGLNIYLFFYLVDSKPFAAVSFAPAANADAKVKAEAAELEKRHSKWLYQMPEETVSALLPFLSLPEEKAAEPAKPKKTAVKKAPPKKASAAKKKKETKK